MKKDSLAPRILITNDDGIAAPGLAVLERIARKLSKDVWVVSPEQEQSGASHSLTLHSPVRVRKLAERRYAVNGTPTDCVLLGMQTIMKSSIPVEGKGKLKAHAGNPLLLTPAREGRGKKVDLVLSGVNRGSNVGDDITYSGTVAGAMEGTMLEVPSIALSQQGEYSDHIHWATAERHAPGLIKKLMRAGWPKNTLININFPDRAPDKVKGVKICPQGKRLVRVALSERVDPKGRPYFWIGGEREDKSDRHDVDIALLEKGYITVTPINMDMTDYRTMEKIGQELA